MAEIRSSPFFQVDLRPIDGQRDLGEVIRADSTQIWLRYPNNFIEVYQGIGFTYDFIGNVVAGKVFRYAVLQSGVLAFEAIDPSGASASFVYQAIIDGTYSRLFGKLLEGDDLILGSWFDDFLWGYGGNDVFAGYKGNDTINGGPGKDTAVYSGPRNQYTVEKVPSGLKVFDRMFDRDGIDTLIDVERIRFQDGTLAFDFFGTAGQVYRLYQAALARVPDQEGLSYWINMVENYGASMRDIGYAMLMSHEFSQKYGSPAQPENFIRALYLNILSREPDAGGFAYWLETLACGADILDVLWVFSESQENIVKTMPLMADGIWLI